MDLLLGGGGEDDRARQKSVRMADETFYSTDA
jgi:hypothetical protein